MESMTYRPVNVRPRVWVGVLHEAQQALRPTVVGLAIAATPLVMPLQDAWRAAPDAQSPVDDQREDFTPIPQAMTYTAASSTASPVRHVGYALDLHGDPPRLFLRR